MPGAQRAAPWIGDDAATTIHHFVTIEPVALPPDAGLRRGWVRHVERLGADAIVHLDVAGVGEIVARTGGETTLAAGAEVWAGPQEGAGHRSPG